jgi:hypothetical protein
VRLLDWRISVADKKGVSTWSCVRRCELLRATWPSASSVLCLEVLECTAGGRSGKFVWNRHLFVSSI